MVRPAVEYQRREVEVDESRKVGQQTKNILA